MENYFEDIKRELVNGHQFAENYDEFVSKILKAIQTGMNDTDVGQKIMDEAVGAAIRKGLTAEEWKQQKANMMKLLFVLILDECPMLKKEMARHLYNELRS